MKPIPTVYYFHFMHPFIISSPQCWDDLKLFIFVWKFHKMVVIQKQYSHTHSHKNLYSYKVKCQTFFFFFFWYVNLFTCKHIVSTRRRRRRRCDAIFLCTHTQGTRKSLNWYMETHLHKKWSEKRLNMYKLT